MVRYYEPEQRPLRFRRVLQSWDTANKATELSDYSVCTTWERVGNEFYLVDVFRQRLNYPDLKRKVKALADQHRPHTNRPQAHRLRSASSRASSTSSGNGELTP